MKKLMIGWVILLLWVPCVQAQQETGEKKSLVEQIIQIAANGVYLNYIKKGYKIAQEGLDTVHSFKNGEFKLHQAFFKSLREVNPNVRAYTRVLDTISLKNKITQESRQLLKLLTNSHSFSDGEKNYLSGVLERLFENCIQVQHELSIVIKDEELEMKDDERLARIDKLFLLMRDNCNFFYGLQEEVKMLALARNAEHLDVEKIGELYDLNN